MSVHIGIDFDNTIARYDELFHQCALDRGLIPPRTPKSKAAVRAHLWTQPDGNTPWTELQGIVYGERMKEAPPCPGSLDFFAFCRDSGLRVSIVSHKIEFPALGPQVNMREAASTWIKEHGLYSDELGHVYFESSRQAKIERIADLGCTHFIDDLAEVFSDPCFPDNVEKILYAREAHADSLEDQVVRAFSDWPAIIHYFDGILKSGS
ncbi:hypothetical protein ACFLQR_01890 [Verrucomicrobiota bacterium]